MHPPTDGEVRDKFIQKYGEPSTTEDFVALGEALRAAKKARELYFMAQGAAAIAAVNAGSNNTGDHVSNDGDDPVVVRDPDGTVHMHGGRGHTAIVKKRQWRL